MKLIFIRHGEPDYVHDSLTKKGDREAMLLADRVSKMDVDEFYVSPLGRAQRTAGYTLDKMGRSAECLDWIQEFRGRMTNRPDKPGEERICWDWQPKDWKNDPIFYDRDNWTDAKLFEGSNIKSENEYVCRNFDKFLADHGYVRNGNLYTVVKPNNDTIVFFCHFAITCVLIGRLLNISPFLLWHNFCAAPTSVTTVVTEEKTEGIANFRLLEFGDISHLYAGNEKPSFMARFCECFMNENENHGD